MKHGEPPFVRLYNLADLGRAGDEVMIALGDDDRRRVAAWAEVDGVGKFEAKITLDRISTSRFSYRADLEADITQSCVVTLEPVPTHIARTFSRELHYIEHAPRHEPRSESLTLAAADDEAPETIEDLEFDLAGPLLEEFSLAIDPYPRAPGVTFEAPTDKDAEQEGPFAALKALKARG